ncbi:MAG: 4'-phosphopantetheinyl transferase superfamily protein [Lachnospiraceae bacterium]|nr:4'-phosphopantetheinyl transferase superfamily protein [Lachnospiraceae bacterium]
MEKSKEKGQCPCHEEKRERIRKAASGILAEVLSSPAEYASLPRTENGKPYFPDGEVFFSLSHSGDLLGMALSFSAPVGFDLQEIRPLKKTPSAIAARFFSESEKELLAKARDEAEKERLFFRLWAVKEAYAKWTGLGMKQGFCSEVLLSQGLVRSTLSSSLSVKEGDAVFRTDTAVFTEPSLCGEHFTCAVCAASLPQDLILRVVPLLP